METFSALLALCVGNSPVTGEFSTQRPVTQSFDVFWAWTNGWVNNREAGDLRCHRAHYDITVMVQERCISSANLMGPFFYKPAAYGCKDTGPHVNIKMVFPDMGISIIKIRRSWDRLIFIMGIHILVRQHLHIETGPWSQGSTWDYHLLGCEFNLAPVQDGSIFHTFISLPWWVPSLL